MQNLSYENEFDMHEKEHVGRTHFDVNGFAGMLVLTQRQKATWNWPIEIRCLLCVRTKVERKEF